MTQQLIILNTISVEQNQMAYSAEKQNDRRSMLSADLIKWLENRLDKDKSESLPR